MTSCIKSKIDYFDIANKAAFVFFTESLPEG